MPGSTVHFHCTSALCYWFSSLGFSGQVHWICLTQGYIPVHHGSSRFPDLLTEWSHRILHRSVQFCTHTVYAHYVTAPLSHCTSCSAPLHFYSLRWDLVTHAPARCTAPAHSAWVDGYIPARLYAPHCTTFLMHSPAAPLLPPRSRFITTALDPCTATPLGSAWFTARLFPRFCTHRDSPRHHRIFHMHRISCTPHLGLDQFWDTASAPRFSARSHAPLPAGTLRDLPLRFLTAPAWDTSARTICAVTPPRMVLSAPALTGWVPRRFHFPRLDPTARGFLHRTTPHCHTCILGSDRSHWIPFTSFAHSHDFAPPLRADRCTPGTSTLHHARSLRLVRDTCTPSCILHDLPWI